MYMRSKIVNVKIVCFQILFICFIIRTLNSEKVGYSVTLPDYQLVTKSKVGY